MSKKPNILLFLTDQHRLSAVGAYGNTPCRTPNIDKLAEEGVRFENAYTICPVCSPARATIMTGLFPRAHGVTANIHEPGCSIHELRDRPSLLSRMLERGGYGLGYSGKWHLGTDWKETFRGSNIPSLPRDVGFEGQNFPGHGGGGFHYPEYGRYLHEHGCEHKVRRWQETLNDPYVGAAGELEGPLESTVPYFLAENTISLIDNFNRQGRPFFVWHNFWGPHEPYFTTKEFLDIYRSVEIPPWPNYGWPSLDIQGPHRVKTHSNQKNLSWSYWQGLIRHYYAFTSLIDNQIGRILAHLKKTGELDNTIIMFAADHGETLGSHGGLVDKGWHHFEETHRIPMIIRFSDGSHSGRTIDKFVSLADLYPTILDMAGISCDEEDVHGRSLVPLIEGRAGDWRDTAITEFGGLGGLAMTQVTLRVGNLKYGYNCCCEDELYDLDKDPYEMHNAIKDPEYRSAAADFLGRVKNLERSIREFIKKGIKKS